MMCTVHGEFLSVTCPGCTSSWGQSVPIKKRVLILMGWLEGQGPRAVLVDAETLVAFGPTIGEKTDREEKDAFFRARDFLEYLTSEKMCEDVTSIESHILLSLYKEWVGR